MKRSSSCVHCVVTRAVARCRRCYARPFDLFACSSRAPMVPMEGSELYALVSDFLRTMVEARPGDGVVGVSGAGSHASHLTCRGC